MGHSQLCDCADLDTSFSHFEKSLPQPEIKVHEEIRFIFLSVILGFQTFTEKPVFERPFKLLIYGACLKWLLTELRFRPLVKRNED